MKTQRERTVIRAVGAGLVIGGAALSAVLLAGAQAPHVADNAQLEEWVWINTDGVNTVGITPVDTLPSDTIGKTVVGLPGPTITVTDGNTPGNTIVWFPGGAIVTGSTVVF